MKQVSSICAIVVLLMAMTACTSFEKAAYVSLESARAVSEAGMETCADLKVSGEISQDQWDGIADIYVTVQEAGASASMAMAVYQETKDEGTARAAIQALLDRAAFFVDRVEALSGKELPVALKMLM